MGYMSRQWLNRGQQIRDRSYGPIPVEVSCYPDDFNGMRVRFSARKSDGQYQTLFLSETEVNAAIRLFIPYASTEMRGKVLLTLMRELSHAKLLRTLAQELQKRFRLPRQS